MPHEDAAAREDDLIVVKRRLAEAEAMIAALLDGQIDAIIDTGTRTPVLLAKAQDALRASEERYRRIVETTHQGIWLIDAEHKTTFMNLRMAQILGCEADMGLGRTPFDFLDDDDQALFRRHAGHRGTHQAEIQHVRLDGTRVWTLYEVTTVFDAAGIYEGMIAMVMDISERKQAEAALRTSEARLRRLWESGVILVTVSDHEGKIIEINDAGLRMLGYTRQELLAARIGWQQLTPTEWEEADRIARVQLSSNGVTSPFEKEVLRKDGTRVSILAAAAILDGIEGISIAVDLSDRKRAENALLERMRIAALTADVGMLITHEASLHTTLDRAATAVVKHLEVSFARIWILDAKAQVLELVASVGRPLERSGPHGRIPLGELGIGRMAKARRPKRSNQLSQDRRPGDVVFEGITAVAGFPMIVNDELVGFLAMYSAHSISDPSFAALSPIADALAVEIQRKRIQTANADLESQLRQSQKMEAVGRLAGGIAHDFNNILTVILSCSELLRAELRDDDPARFEADEISKAGTRAAALTRQLLMFSRQQVLEPKVLDLGALARNVQNMLGRVLGEDVELVLRTEADLCRVRADPGSIEQVLMNLVVNARDAMPTGGTLTIETRSGFADETPGTDPRVLLVISDTGCGMVPATLARIFEPFFTTKDVGKGTGLGLSTVFGIVEQSGGKIEVHSELGTGTTFTISLPAVSAATDVPTNTTGPARRGTETILLVEDEAQVRAVARALLERSGYDVIEMQSGSDALTYCQTHTRPIHLLLTDVVMPQMSGPELFRHLVAVRPDLRVLCVSGYADDSIVRHGVLQADLAYLQKPFTAESLTRKVREVLDAQSKI